MEDSKKPKMEEIKKQMTELSFKEKEDKTFKFWSTQPMLSINDKVDGEFGPIDTPKTVDDVSKAPIAVGKHYEWVAMDVTKDEEMAEIYELLTHHYVEDDDNMFRFDYSRDFLLWALTPPGYKPDWHVGLRQKHNGKLVAFITGIPVHMRVYEETMPMAEINFLCIHRNLRSKRLAPRMIQEVTRRVNLCNIWQAVYTAGVVLPRPVAQCRYYHRSINPKKLVEIKFCGLGPRMTINRLVRLNKLPEKPSIPLRPMTSDDVAQVTEMLNKKLESTAMAQCFTEEEVNHWLVTRAGVIDSWVHEVEGKIVDFISYYHLPSSVLNNPRHNKLNAVYLYYHFAGSIPLKQLLKDALILANNNGCDVFNALDLMENKPCFEELRFGAGDGELQYYIYNWKCPQMKPEGVGLVLL
eukprot:TRINITY_DN8696_c0_g1_i1.p1 TRINITY_DN8696_c0_g1~~TRINITY_DN8696_c0_g1_i1.p1  ORF type:complete len:410 (-),score=132.63 TRINITY_DN8696_c0_g1_i1:171-1400(-)